jgi:hypothetical protein
MHPRPWFLLEVFNVYLNLLHDKLRPLDQYPALQANEATQHQQQQR